MVIVLFPTLTSEKVDQGKVDRDESRLGFELLTAIPIAIKQIPPKGDSAISRLAIAPRPGYTSFDI